MSRIVCEIKFLLLLIPILRSLGGSCEPVLSCLLALGVVTGSCGGGLWSVCCEQAASSSSSSPSGAGGGPTGPTGIGASGTGKKNVLKWHTLLPFLDANWTLRFVHCILQHACAFNQTTWLLVSNHTLPSFLKPILLDPIHATIAWQFKK